MAIKLTTNGTSLVDKALKAFKVSPSLLKDAESAGIIISQTSVGAFAITSCGKTYATIKLDPKVITLAHVGNLGPSSLGAITAQFEDGLKTALKAHPPKMENTVSAPSLKKLFGGGSKPAEEVVEDFGHDGNPLPTPAKALTATIALYKSTVPYEPVKASSMGSVYYTFAVSSTLKLACRYKDDTLSIRAEGDALGIGYEAKVAPKVAALGMTKSSSSNGHPYLSVHLHAPARVQAQKALGACLAMLGPHNFTIGDLETVLDLGGA